MRPRNPGAPLSDDAPQAVQHGLALLARRARTAAELLRERLAERFEAPAVTAALRRLSNLGYVDDRAWGDAYVAHVRSAERSAHLLRSELRARGLGADLAAAVVASHDDDAAALAAARRLARASRGREPEVRTRRLRGALARRGFAAETIERAIAALSALTAPDAGG